MAIVSEYWATQVRQAIEAVVAQQSEREQAYIFGRVDTLTDPPRPAQTPGRPPLGFKVVKSLLIGLAVFLIALAGGAWMADNFASEQKFLQLGQGIASDPNVQVDPAMEEFLRTATIGEVARGDNPLRLQPIVPGDEVLGQPEATPEAIAKTSLQAAWLGGILAMSVPGLIIAGLVLGVLRWLRKQRAKREYEQMIADMNTAHMLQLKEWRKREDSMVAELDHRINSALGFDYRKFQAMEDKWAADATISVAMDRKEFLDTAFRVNPLRNEWPPLLNQPRTRSWRNPVLHNAVRTIEDYLRKQTFWRDSSTAKGTISE